MTSPDTPSGANGNHDHNQDSLAPPRMTDSPTPMTEATTTDDEGPVHQNGNNLEHGGSEDDTETSEEEDDDDEEPSLKYQRITGAVPDLLRKDSASALAVSNKLLVCSDNTCFDSQFTYSPTGNGHPRRHHTHSRHNRDTNKILQTPHGLDYRHLARCNRRFRRHGFH
jgi:hypothetical protein